MSRYKNFPPGWENIKVPLDSKAATLAGMGTYAPCLPKGIWGQRVLWALVRIGGSRALPGKSFEWTPPLAADDWQSLNKAMVEAVGPFDSHTVYERRRGRAGLLMLLMREGRPVGFLKARHGSADEIAHERLALEALETTPPLSFRAPRVLGASAIADWHFVVTAAMPAGIHSMLPAAPPGAIHDEIEAALQTIPKDDGTPDHWRPFHGDFTPWNLRRFKTGHPWLFDWEECGWAPPGADSIFYRASAYAIGRPLDDMPFEKGEASDFWRQWVRERSAANAAAGLEERPLDRGLAEAFGEDT